MTLPSPGYAELHCLSNFSFLRGASHPGELVSQAAALGYAALALTDECSVAGVVRAHAAAREHGLKLIVGSELNLEDGIRLVVLAPSRRAYGDLATLISAARRNEGTESLARDKRLPRSLARRGDAGSGRRLLARVVAQGPSLARGRAVPERP
jgi:error-prone DNA polymerase